mmetsp:Transcript_18008/g.46173  ORF Transcript_18008/g.46173 Transcript_18008/m.46173 type:complete len:211 (-) Transcript_18008:112-744(-)
MRELPPEPRRRMEETAPEGASPAHGGCAGATWEWPVPAPAACVHLRSKAAAEAKGSPVGRPPPCCMSRRMVCSSAGSCARSTQWMQLTGQMAAATWMRSSLSPHCVTARALPYFISTLKVLLASKAHFRQPTQAPSSTNTARLSPSPPAQLDSAAPVKPSNTCASLRATSKACRCRGSDRTRYASFSSTPISWPSAPPAMSGWHRFCKYL